MAPRPRPVPGATRSRSLAHRLGAAHPRAPVTLTLSNVRSYDQPCATGATVVERTIWTPRPSGCLAGARHSLARARPPRRRRQPTKSWTFTNRIEADALVQRLLTAKPTDDLPLGRANLGQPGSGASRDAHRSRSPETQHDLHERQATRGDRWWPGAGSNRRPSDFQSDARTN